MANTATKKTAITGFGGSRFNGQIFPYWCSHDTINSDVALATPATGKRTAIVGASLLIDIAATVQFKSASTIIQPFKFAANSGIALPFCPDNLNIYAIGEPSEIVSFTSSAILGLFQLFAVEI
jgi:hypothetical protein